MVFVRGVCALQAVMSVDAERHRLEAEAERLAEQLGDEVEQRLEDIYERWAGGWEAESARWSTNRQRLSALCLAGAARSSFPASTPSAHK